MTCFDKNADFGYYNDGIIVKLPVYAKAMHYKQATVRKLITEYHKKQRKIRVTTPCGDYICLNTIISAIQNKEHNITMLQRKLNYHYEFVNRWTKSLLILACFINNKYE